MKAEELEEYLETHYEIVQAITVEYMKDKSQGRVREVHDENGHGGLYQLAKELTDKFQATYKDIVWGMELEWFDTIEEFLKEELK
jgi:creatinine amidohydrolase/Fe(II)-dependent formamide hydrolase-like protein